MMSRLRVSVFKTRTCSGSCDRFITFIENSECPSLSRLLAVALAGVSFVAVVALRPLELVLGQDKVTKAKPIPADSVPPDGEFTPFGIYEKTAPRPQADHARRHDLPLKLKPGDRIALIGNTLFERAQEFGNFEAMLQQRFPGDRTGRPQPRLVGGRDRPAAAAGELRRHRAAPDAREGGRDLRRVRLQRVVRRRGGAAGVQARSWRRTSPDLKAKAFNGKTRAADRARLADRERERRRACRRRT